MRQLIAHHGFQVLIALNTQAILITEGNVTVELTKTESQCEGAEIQAVALTKEWAAVALHDKTLALYSINENIADETISATTIYKIPKRASSLVFASVKDMIVVLASDLGGDVSAYPVLKRATSSKDDEEHADSNSNHRLLLGHTASMISSMRLVDNRYLLTADRDEKIRVSKFPETYDIHGFLLGHAAFVSDICAVPKTSLCVSCGGDKTMRLWNYETCQELSSVILSHIPTKVVYVSTYIVVSFDQSPKIQFFRLSPSADPSSLVFVGEIECTSHVLGLDSHVDCYFYAILGEPDYAQLYWIDNDELTPIESAVVDVIKIYTRDHPQTMPTAILERDKNGQLKFQKTSDERGPAHTQPWNDPRRVEIARERNRRSKRRRSERKQETES